MLEHSVPAIKKTKQQKTNNNNNNKQNATKFALPGIWGRSDNRLCEIDDVREKGNYHKHAFLNGSITFLAK